MVLAHRGGAGEGPESTLALMREVLARDPQVGIELDVRRTRDGHIVVIHDASVDRTTNGRGRVADLTLAELQALDAGHCATPGRGAGTARRGECRAGAAGFPWRGRRATIATLAEVLAALPPRTLVGIEVKTGGFEEALAGVLRASGRLGSGDGGGRRRRRGGAPALPAARGRALFPALGRGAAGAGGEAGRRPAGAPHSPGAGGADRGRGPQPGHRRRGGTARARGVLVAYWTIDDEAEMERLLRLGADALITNYPGRARAVITRLRAAGVLGALTMAPAAALMIGLAVQVVPSLTAVFPPEDDRRRRTSPSPTPRGRACWPTAPTRRMLATAGGRHTIRLWNARPGASGNGEALRTLAGHRARLTALAFAPDGTTLVAMAADGAARTWEVTSGRALRATSLRAAAGRVVALRPGKEPHLAVASAARAAAVVELWDHQAGTLVRKLERPSELRGRAAGAARSLAFTSDGKLLAAGLGRGVVAVWDAETGALVRAFEGAAVKALAVAPSHVAAGASNGTVRWWALPGGGMIGRHRCRRCATPGQ